MIEQIQSFGPQQHLQGIYTAPEEDCKKPCFLIINAGAVHKSGPFNLHVHLAKFLADLGYASFRFDLSGQGDSTRIASPSSRTEQITKDMLAALDCLENQFNHCSVISFGLCTGAENAHKIAVKDDRVKGLVWIDGYGYLSPKFNRVKFLKKLSQPFNLIKALIKRLTKTKAMSSESSDNQANNVDDYVWRLPEKSQYKADMEVLHQREAKCLYVYSGGVQSYYNYQGQMKDAFPGEFFTQIFEEVYFPKADHTFFMLNDKHSLFDAIKNWLSRHY